MITVVVDLPKDRVESAMREMRIWLDQRRFEPSTFRSARGGGALITFKVEEEARAFAAQFGGKVTFASQWAV